MSENSDHNDQYNRGGLYAFIFSMVTVGAMMLYLVVIYPGVDLAEKVIDPNNLPADYKPEFKIETIAEPWVPNEEVVAYGAKLYKTNCALCHGDAGKGDGAGGAGLNPKPRDLVEGKWVKGPGIISKYEVLRDGLGTSMASYKHFKPADRWALSQFIQSITENKGTDDPVKVAEFAKTAE